MYMQSIFYCTSEKSKIYSLIFFKPNSYQLLALLHELEKQVFYLVATTKINDILWPRRSVGVTYKKMMPMMMLIMTMINILTKLPLRFEACNLYYARIIINKIISKINTNFENHFGVFNCFVW